MDVTSTTIRGFFDQDPLDSTLAQALVNLNKGDPGAVCQVIRYGLSTERLRAFTVHLKRQGFVLTLGSGPKFVETVIKIAQTELSGVKVLTLEEILAPGNIEKKKMMVLDVLATSAKKSEELEKAELAGTTSLVSSVSPNRRRSYSAGSEHLRGGSVSMLPIKLDGRNLKPLRPTTNGPMSTETWVSSPPQNHYAGARANGYYSRSPSMSTPPSVLHAAHPPVVPIGRDDEVVGNATRGPVSSNALPLSPRLPTHSNQRLTIPSSLIAEEDNASQSLHQPQSPHLNSGRNGGEQTLSPRERLLSPQRKLPGQTQSYTTIASLKAGRRRLDIEEEQQMNLASLKSLTTVIGSESADYKLSGVPTSPGGNELAIGERLTLIETRIETELAAMNERFSRLENTINDLARVILAQARNGATPEG